MSVLKIKDGEGNWVGVTAIKGDKGDAGTSPVINVSTNTSTTYKLRVITEDRDFVTPNLKGQGGSGSGSASSELGTIANYKDFDGINIPAYNMDMPPLACYEGGTTYVFDREVTMLVYDGTFDENGNTDIDKYVSYTGTEIFVPTMYTGQLTDYLIYNPVPKKEWDTWENPNIVKFISPHDSRLFNYDLTNQEDGWFDERYRWAHIPNLKLIPKSNDPELVKVTPFKSGEAVICKQEKWNSLLGKYESDKGNYNIAVYNRADFPFILDEPVVMKNYDKELKEFTGAVTIEYPSVQWDNLKDEYPKFRKGIDYTLDDMRLDACAIRDDGKPVVVDSNERLMQLALEEKEELAKANVAGAGYNRCYDMVVAQQSYVEKHLSDFGAKPVAPAMFIGLEPLKNYTIETTASDCAIILTNNINNRHITKRNTVMYPTQQATINAAKKQVQEIGSSWGGLGGGVVTGGNKLTNGTVLTYEMVDTTADPECELEIPCAMSIPKIYLKKGDSYTFQVEDEDVMYGIWVFCWQEEDYQGIKVVEGIEPYSVLMAERMASGATKFNIKSYWTPDESAYAVDRNQIMQEFNVKLCDNTTENDYCRYLSSDTIKNYDLDVFSMEGHKHNIGSLNGVDDFVEELRVPKMQLGTSTLVDGESELAENTFYFVYEE